MKHQLASTVFHQAIRGGFKRRVSVLMLCASPILMLCASPSPWWALLTSHIYIHERADSIICVVCSVANTPPSADEHRLIPALLDCISAKHVDGITEKLRTMRMRR